MTAAPPSPWMGESCDHSVRSSEDLDVGKRECVVRSVDVVVRFGGETAGDIGGVNEWWARGLETRGLGPGLRFESSPAMGKLRVIPMICMYYIQLREILVGEERASGSPDGVLPISIMNDWSFIRVTRGAEDEDCSPRLAVTSQAVPTKRKMKAHLMLCRSMTVRTRSNCS